MTQDPLHLPKGHGNLCLLEAKGVPASELCAGTVNLRTSAYNMLELALMLNGISCPRTQNYPNAVHVPI